MTITKAFPGGQWVITAVVDGVLVRRIYFLHTKLEAKALFKMEFRGKI